MSRSLILPILYQMVDSLTIANGFSFDWVSVTDGDLRRGDRLKASVTIRLLDDENIDDDGANGSAEYLDIATVEITTKVNISTPNARGDSVPYLANIASSKMMDDIKQRYDSPAFLCQNGVKCRALQYVGCAVEDVVTEGKYRTIRNIFTFKLIYATNKRLIDL